MEEPASLLKLDRVNTRKVSAGLLALAAAATLSASAQTQFRFLFQGTCYQSNGTGNIAPTTITDQTLLQDRARQLGISDPSTIALVYRVNGDSKGDVVNVMRVSDGAILAQEFGFWFFDNGTSNLDRTCITNATQTEVLHIDYVYTLEDATYVSANGHSMGCAFTTRRFSNGNVTTISGPMQWIVNPGPNSSTKVINGNFSLGAPFP